MKYKDHAINYVAFFICSFEIIILLCVLVMYIYYFEVDQHLSLRNVLLKIFLLL